MCCVPKPVLSGPKQVPNIKPKDICLVSDHLLFHIVQSPPAMASIVDIFFFGNDVRAHRRGTKPNQTTVVDTVHDNNDLFD